MFARKSRVSQRPNGLSKRRRHMVTRRSKALQGPSKPLVRRLSRPLMGSLPQPLGSFHEDGNTLLARDPRSTSKPPTCSTMRPTSIVNTGSRAAHRETQGRRGRGTTGAPLTTVETATWSENSRYCPIPPRSSGTRPQVVQNKRRVRQEHLVEPRHRRRICSPSLVKRPVSRCRAPSPTDVKLRSPHNGSR